MPVLAALKFVVPSQAATKGVSKRDIPVMTGIPLIITHPESEFDVKEEAREPIERLERTWRHGPVTVLHSLKDKSGMYIEPQQRSSQIYSYGGELRAKFQTDRVVIAGGYLGYSPMNCGCMTATIADVILFHQKSRPGKPLTIHLFADSVYHFEGEPRLTPKSFRRHLFINRDIFYPKGTAIALGVLPEVPGFEKTIWPPMGQDLPKPMRRRYSRLNSNNWNGHLNDVTIYKYQFHFEYEGQPKPKLSKGDGELQVTFKIWKSQKSFEQKYLEKGRCASGV